MGFIGVLFVAAGIVALCGLLGLIVALVALNRIAQLERRLDRFVQAVMDRQNTVRSEREQDGQTSDDALDETPSPDLTATETTAGEDLAISGPTRADNDDGIAESEPVSERKNHVWDVVTVWIGHFSENWIFWLSGVSLALGGLFLVRYGIEAGYLGPAARVIAALLFGTGLLVASDWMRRRFRSEGWFDLPPTLAAAGIFSLFGGVLAGHVLYDLFDAAPTFGALAVVSVFAVFGGVLFGPMLSVIGILGGYLAPFLLKTGEPSAFLLIYFAVIFATALLVERVQKWIWLSAYAALLALVTGWMISSAVPLSLEPYLFATALAALAVAVPAFGVFAPAVPYARLPALFLDLSRHYPSVFALATTAAALSTALLFEFRSHEEQVIGMIAGLLLATWLVFAMAKAEPLRWTNLIALVFSGVVLARGFDDLRSSDGLVTGDVALGAGLALLAAYGGVWRAERTRFPRMWYWVGAIFPVAILLWMVGRDATSGDGVAFASQTIWGWIAVGVACCQGAFAWLTLMGHHRSRRNGADLFAVSASASTAIAIHLLLPDALWAHAFTVIALGASWAVSVYKFRVTRHAIWIFVGYALVWLLAENYRNLTDPVVYLGLTVWGPIGSHLIYISAVALFVLAWRFAIGARLAREVVQFETAALVGLAVYLLAWIDLLLAENGAQDYVVYASTSSVFFILTAAALYRLIGASHMVNLRYVLVAIYALLAIGYLASSLANSSFVSDLGQVAGVFPIDTLTLSYGPIIGLLVLAGGLDSVTRIFSKWVLWAPAVLVAGFLGISLVRWYWHGPNIQVSRGFLQPELYTYSVIMIVATGVLVWITLSRRSLTLKRYALGLAAATAAKVFLVDMAGMTGLSRASIFMLLGALLAGIAWLLKDLTVDKVSTDEPKN
ncbi:MAG: DUF2339 domain-containing protein [Pseudomonadota bacterium]